MNSRIKILACTSLIVLNIFGLGCTSGPTLSPQQALEQNFEVMRDAAMKTIENESSLQQFLVRTRTLESLLLEYNQAFNQFATELGELNSKYQTPRSEQEALLKAFTDKRKITMQKVVNLHFEMIELTTAKEWKQIVKYETEALESMRQLPQDQLGAGS